MKSKFQIGGHPVHPMLIPFPIAFYTATVVCYIAYANNGDPLWFRVGHVANVAGVAMAFLAAIPGIVDYTKAIPRENAAKRTGLIHAALNSTALILFLVNAIVQGQKWNENLPDTSGAVGLTLIGLLCTLAAGVYGWNLTQKHHLGIDMTSEQERLEPADPGNVFSPKRRTRVG